MDPRPFSAVLVLLALGGCAPAPQPVLADVWRNEAYSGPFGRALVIGMAKPAEARRRFENSIVLEFQARGVGAIPGAEVLPPAAAIGEGAVRAKIEQRGIDVVLVTRVVGGDEETEVVRGPPSAVPGRYENLYGYYFWSATRTRDGPSHSDLAIARLETSIYDARSEKLIWTGMSELFDPKRTDAMIRKVSREVLSRLAEEGWIG